MSAAPKGSKFVEARITTITYVLWEIWKAKCLATYGAVPMNARAVALCIIFEVQCVPLYLQRGQNLQVAYIKTIVDIMGLPATTVNVRRGR